MVSQLPHLPFVGRSEELARLDDFFAGGASGRGGALLLVGEGGVGKTRFTVAARELAQRRGFTVAHGRGYPVEVGVPYALFADALLPCVRELDRATLSVLTRGGESELAYLLPGLSAETRPTTAAGEDPAEFKTRLLWNFTEFLRRFGAKRPLLVLLEDLHWADASSLELLHFAARHLAGDHVLLMCSYVDAERERLPALRALEQSLVSLGLARVVNLRPLGPEETLELVSGAFDVEPNVMRAFAQLLFDWTRGNPFFIQETLQTLVDSGRLRREGGRWVGWNTGELTLPRTVRESLLARVDRLNADARRTADLAAVIGTRVTHAVLRSVSALSGEALLEALDAVRAARVLEERAEGSELVYDFAHPLIRETVYGACGIARARLLHAAVAEALEAHYGDDAMTHADELAYHFARAEAESLAPKAVRYLIEAGRRALARFANREAADYLGLALRLAGRAPENSGEAVSGEEHDRLRVDLARVRQRLGEHGAAIALLREARDDLASDDARGHAVVQRRLGLALYWSGRREDAIAELSTGLSAAADAGDERLRASLLLARGTALLDGGDATAGLADVETALAIAEQLDDPALLARVHRGLVLLYTWSGRPDDARAHGDRAIELARATAEPTVAFGAHWALAVLEGLIGETAAMRRHIDACERLAEKLRSPMLWLTMAETSIEYHAAVGDWDAALGIGERAIALARSLNARAILPRMLVWNALLQLARGETEHAHAAIEEAWTLSGADDPERGDVHVIVCAHIGRAACHLWRSEYAEAIRVGEAGLRVADRSGYVFWAIHRLLPIVIEAHCQLGDLRGAKRAGRRLRRESERLGHKLGMAWADSADALLAWLGGDPHRGARLLRGACDALDAIPIVLDAARLRRQLAGRLADTGDRDGALHELRTVHQLFARLNVTSELDKARDQFRELGAKPPTRSTGEGTEALTGRELEIVTMVAARKTNKAIGRTLGISARTVSTHMSNIFRKLSVETRGELADFVRAGRLIEK